MLLWRDARRRWFTAAGLEQPTLKSSVEVYSRRNSFPIFFKVGLRGVFIVVHKGRRYATPSVVNMHRVETYPVCGREYTHPVP